MMNHMRFCPMLSRRRVKVFDSCRSNRVVIFEAWFHAFSTEGDGNEIYPVAVLEKDDGSIEIVSAARIKFIEE